MMENNKGIIYCYTNKVNGKCYVGQTINPVRRKAEHLRRAFSGNYTENNKFYNALRKYGIDGFIYDVLETCDESDLDELETKWIKEMNSLQSGYNSKEGGKSRRGFKHTEKTKKLLSSLNKGENNPNYGTKASEETKEKLRLANLGKIQSKETISKRVEKNNKKVEQLDFEDKI
jgi:group I intron endonuclease